MTQEFVTLPREVVEQVRGALAYVGVGNASENPNLAQSTCRQAIWKLDHALRAALEQPQANQPAMTPIAQRKLDSLLTEGYTISGYSIYNEQKHQHGFVTGAGLVGWWKPEGVEYPQPQGGQEPVAEIQVKNGHWIDTPVARTAHLVDGVYKLYTHPQPKREPLTDERIDAIADAMPGGLEGFLKGWGWRQFARAVLEATHNIK